jgi:CheY-like chemotaxis protein
LSDNARTILIIDDDPAICELARRFLEHHDYRVLTAEDTAAALRIMEIHRPDLILLDVHLGSEDGLVLLARMKAHPLLKPIPVIMLTAHAGTRSCCASHPHRSTGLHSKTHFREALSLAESPGQCSWAIWKGTGPPPKK